MKKKYNIILLIILIITFLILLLKMKNIEKFSDNNITIVSSYYPMKSKHSVEKYKKWIKNLFENVPFNLVFFTNKEYTPFIKDIRKNFSNTKIITLEFEELEVFKKYPLSFWKEQKKLDHEEYHIPELYAIWYEKKEFIKKTIEVNPFNSEYFVWTDAGICRDTNWIPYLKNYPCLNKIPINKILINKIKNFSDKNEYYDFKNDLENIGAGIIGGNIKAWQDYDILYNKIFNIYINDNRFVGKEQNLITTMCIKKPELFELYNSKDFKTNKYEYNKWFSLLFYLAEC